ncbi:Hypothetical protein NGAL_HAMBI2610_46990 [Neorhizobium galegae bv. orientalis]|nr:Hypothetical protein NGAL_HAMBI2610_46990 [Neorhizobium galegae bv. orientalis]
MALEIITALVSDYLSSKAIAGAGTFSVAGGMVLQRLLRKRAETAREILIEELRQGDRFLEEVSEDEAAAIIFRYMRAAEEGAARRNLRLLAAVIAGQAAEESLYADEFLMWADIIASLRSDEIAVLAVVHKHAEALNYTVERSGTFWGECMETLRKEHDFELYRSDGAAASLLRTGLIQLLGGLADMGHAYLPGKRLSQLGKLIDIEGVSARDR